jgi:hypothetical protein
MTEKKIPNSLTILINTKLPNYYKLNYDPSMSVPKTKSHIVYFDPLVKYDLSAINNIPRGSPKETILTQFFEPNQFDSMINRILSNFFSMQKERTIEESMKQNIINTNIDITLKTLFRTNNILYLNGAPYTIVSMNWRKNEWEIDKKPLDKLLSQNIHLTPSQIEEQVTKEKQELGIISLSGAPVAAGIASTETANIAATELKELAIKSGKTSLIKEEVQTFEPFISNKVVLDNMDESFKRLYSKYLQQNNPINYDIMPDLVRDPLTFTLILDYNKLSEYIEANNDSETSTFYNAVIQLKKQLQIEDKVYQDLCVTIAEMSKTFNDKMNNFYKKLVDYKTKISEPDFNTAQVNTLIDKIVQLKSNFMNIYIQICESLMKIYNIQNQYFNALKLLLVRLKDLFKNQYIKLIPYFEKPTLVLKCVEYDINILNYLLVKDNENSASSSYFDNLKRFKKFYEDIIQLNKEEYINPQINYNEELQKYLYTNPDILLTEINQFKLYIYRILINYSYVQLDIWMLYLTTIKIFTGFIKDVYSSVDLETANNIVTEYDKKYPNSNSDFLEKYKVDGMRATPATGPSNDNPEMKWYLVNKDGEPCIPNEADAILQEKNYIDMVKSQVFCYDSIILFMYLVEISCLRREKIIIAEENIQQLNLENSNHFRSYFKSVQNLINDYNTLTNKPNPIYIPSSINWDVNRFVSIKNTDDSISTSVIEKQLEINERSNALYLSKIELLQDKHKKLVRYCNDYIVSLLSPSISEEGFIKFCNIIYSDSIIDDKYIPTSTYWIQRELGNYDFENTNNFNYLMMDVASEAYFSGILETRTPEGYINWIVINNEGDGDCLFASVRDALNGQLIIENATTTNDYTEIVDGTKQFTIHSLRRLVAENFEMDKYDLLCGVAGGTIQSNKCIMNIVQIDELQTNNNNLYNILINETNNTKKIRTLDEVKSYIQEPKKFWGESISIEILQKILKIKFIIFEMFDESLDAIRLGNYVFYQNEKYVISSTTNNNSNTLFNLKHLDGTDGPQGIEVQNIELANKNILKHLRIVCNDFGQTELYTDYIFLLAVNIAEKGESMKLHYELIKHSTNANFIYKAQDIPEYIKYFMYYNCYEYLSDSAKQSVGFQEFKDNFLEMEQKISEFKSNRIQNKINILNQKIQKYEKELNELSSKVNEKINEEERIKKQLKHQKRISILKEERDELMNRVSSLTQVQEQTAGALQQEYRQNAYNPYFMPYNKQYPYRYNLPIKSTMFNSLIREKDQKTKLTYYVTIDLDLYPGTTANSLQKSSVLCNSRFEEIRHAYADMFGFIYRPSSVGSTFSYEQKYNEDKKKQKENKEKEKENKEKENKEKERKGGKTSKSFIKNKYTKTLKVKNIVT